MMHINGLRKIVRPFGARFLSSSRVLDVELRQNYSSKLRLEVPDEKTVRSSFRVLDEEGKVTGKEGEKIIGNLSQELATKLMKSMVKLEVMDSLLHEVQRQGRISFYMTASGEEGINIGSSEAIKPQDTIFAQYREAGVLLHRGFSIEQIMDQCFSTEDDPGKGRQMPVHYGSKLLNYHTVSSPLATQMPQATGAAYANKMRAIQEDRPLDEMVVCYFGEGAASEGDFHPAVNFAATLDCPVLFFCRNNGYAISTPSSEQFRGDGIVSRAAGYGVASIRVDGNCVLGVLHATEAARKYILETGKPVLLEAMSYRAGHHSTSDDSTSYRDIEEINAFKAKYHPMKRYMSFMESSNWWNSELDTAYRKEIRKEVLKAVKVAENKPKPSSVDDLFNDVYKDMTPNLIKQKRELEEHLAKYPEDYLNDNH